MIVLACLRVKTRRIIPLCFENVELQARKPQNAMPLHGGARYPGILGVRHVGGEFKCRESALSESNRLCSKLKRCEECEGPTVTPH
jgi:hypothetical protein